MKPSIIVGILIAIVVVGSWVFSPVLRSSESKDSQAAAEQAELARRQLQSYSAGLTSAAPQVDLEALRAADFALLSEVVSQTTDGEETPSAGRLQSGVNAFAELLNANKQLLADAIRSADEAARSQGESKVAAIFLIQGTARMLDAEAHFTRAQALRTELSTLSAEALNLGMKRRMTQTQADYYEFLEIEPILDDLRAGEDEADGSREWAQAGADKAHAEVLRLQKAVAERQAQLDGIEQQLRAARDARLTLEKESFTAGDDAAFARFRDRYLAVFEQLRQLERTEQEIQFGTMGEGDDGEVVLGLDALQRELALQQALAERYDAAVKALDRRIEHMQIASDEAQQGVVDYSERLQKHQADLEALLPRLDSLANEAVDAERQALGAASAARQAFSQATSATRQWKTAARQIEDPESANARLNMIKADRYAEQLGSSAEAAARMLEGRVHWQRLSGVARQIDTYSRLADLVGTGTFEEAKLRELMQTSRDEGTKTLEQAVTLYEGLSGGPAETNWVHKSSLAATYYLLSKFNEDEREMLELQAAETLDVAVTPGEKSPYLADQVRFRDYLVKQTGYTAPRSDEPIEDEDLPDAGS